MKRLINAFFYSLSGLKFAWHDEQAFKEEVILAIILIPLAFYISNNHVDLILSIGSILLLLIIELVNSAIEAAVDHTSLERNPLAKKAKDIASSAVMLSIINLILVWAIIIFNR